MKTIKYLVLGCVFVFSGTAYAQDKNYEEVDFADSTGLPGDNFSLQAALETFKASSSLEDFEKRLNAQDNAINNLDLDGDGKTDYIRVVDTKKDNDHAIVLQIPVNAKESQDVAVIQIEKTGESTAVAQIIGDEDLYGETKIVEPVEEKETLDKGGIKRGPAEPFFTPQIIFVNVWFWPCIHYMYAPEYVVWVSPWYWDYYPMWWHPWHPYPWRWYYMNHHHYYHHYAYVHNRRDNAAYGVYGPRRATSPYVQNRNRQAKMNYEQKHPRQNNGGRPANLNNPAKDNQPSRNPVKPGDRPEPRPSNPNVKPEPRPSKPDVRPEPRPSRPDVKPAPRPSRPDVRPAPRPSNPSRNNPQRPNSKPQQRKPR